MQRVQSQKKETNQINARIDQVIGNESNQKKAG
jgi:hypothetical protein